MIHPVVNIQVEGIRHTMMQALHSHHEEIEAHVDAALKQFDFSTVVKEEVQRSIGPVVSDVVRSMVREAVTDIVSNRELVTQLKSSISKVVIESMSTYFTPQDDN